MEYILLLFFLSMNSIKLWQSIWQLVNTSKTENYYWRAMVVQFWRVIHKIFPILFPLEQHQKDDVLTFIKDLREDKWNWLPQNSTYRKTKFIHNRELSPNRTHSSAKWLWNELQLRLNVDVKAFQSDAHV